MICASTIDEMLTIRLRTNISDLLVSKGAKGTFFVSECIEPSPNLVLMIA